MKNSEKISKAGRPQKSKPTLTINYPSQGFSAIENLKDTKRIYYQKSSWKPDEDHYPKLEYSGAGIIKDTGAGLD